MLLWFNTYMSKQVNDEYVNTSYTTLYLFFTVAYSVVISAAFSDASVAVLLAVIGYALLSYFIWDVIRQLFEPGQAVFLYVCTFLMLPALMNLFLPNSVGTIAIVIYLASTLSALIFESIYEVLLKKRLPKVILRRLLSVDTAIDKSIVPLSIKHIQLTEFRGFAIALTLVVLYALAVTLMLRG